MEPPRPSTNAPPTMQSAAAAQPPSSSSPSCPAPEAISSRRNRRPQRCSSARPSSSPSSLVGLPALALAVAAAALLQSPAAATSAFVMGGRWSRSSSSSPSSQGQGPPPFPSSPSSSLVLDESVLFACVSPTRPSAHHHTALHLHYQRHHHLSESHHRLWASSASTTTTAGTPRDAAGTDADAEAAEACLHGLDPDTPTIAFPGGGIFFYWQAGAVHYLQRHFDLTKARLVGASAGALTAALAGCDVNMPLAAETALRLSMSIGLWERPLGLAGVWGGLVRRWLDDLLPPDAAEKCRHRVQLYVNLVERRALRTSGLPLRHERVCDFRDREELLEVAMASVHIPFFMDGKPLKRLGDRGLVLDGSFRLSAAAMAQGSAPASTLVLDHYQDPELPRAGSGPTEFVTLVSPEGIKAMMRAGYRYAKRLHEDGKLGMLAPIARDRFGHHDELQHRPRAHSENGEGEEEQEAGGRGGIGTGSRTGVEVLYSGGGGTAAAATEAEAEGGSGGEGGGGGGLLRARL